MNPLVRQGDIVSFNLNNLNEIKIGDLVAFFQDKYIIAHRIVKKKKIGDKLLYCQKGDNVSGWGWISKEQLVGKAEIIQRNGKNINLLSVRMALSNKIIGYSSYLFISAFEILHPVIVSFAYHPWKYFPEIREKCVKIINKILQIFIF